MSQVGLILVLVGIVDVVAAAVLYRVLSGRQPDRRRQHAVLAGVLASAGVAVAALGLIFFV